MANTRKVAAELISRGFEVKAIDPITREADGAVWVSEKVHVQVGRGSYLNVMAIVPLENGGEGLEFYCQSRDYARICADLRRALSKERV